MMITWLFGITCSVYVVVMGWSKPFPWNIKITKKEIYILREFRYPEILLSLLVNDISHVSTVVLHMKIKHEWLKA